MRRFSLLLIIFILFTTLDVYAFDKCAVSFGSDLKDDEKESIIEALNVSKDTPETDFTIYEQNEYILQIIKEDRLGSKAIISSYVEDSSEGNGINVEISNLTHVTPEMITCAVITAGIEDVNIKIAAPYKVSGSSSLIPIIKAYEKMRGHSISEEAKMAASRELAFMSDLGLRIGMKKSTQFVNEVKKEVIGATDVDTEAIIDIIDKQQRRFNIKLEDDDMNNLVSIMEIIGRLGLTPDSITTQQKNISTYINDLSKTAYKNSFIALLWSKILMFLKEFSMFFKAGK